ncbi:MAG: hypothetical protein COU06_02120 [Candidatus Harrisonbacteria bacterium CG10_big_fil_rev_8_21_14_0_10_38_8]|uniref:Uncharacterized protein n=1 Tax=Candidatus Harrisonbacteria bacterium CG10_big_fil_rev_8_21_14_0_10_38_8 TaxID=1974582 RepID=A0A2M6WJW1_9BACT|nr:MAG: hypothetical protein COU06_02120 [Candidatus Harrisonbacteria bacterium CG10_big_fil_rev_8_21_14_0_10_38_8]
MLTTRVKKQILYGAGYLGFWTLVFFVAYSAFLKPGPSCFDNELNQDEEEVDCGGSFCISCDIRRLAPIGIKVTKIDHPLFEGSTTFSIELQNPNSNYGASDLEYTVTVYDKEGNLIDSKSRSYLIYPRQVVVDSIMNFEITPDMVGEVKATTKVNTWVSVLDFGAPKTQVRDQKLELDRRGNQFIFSGILKNDNPFKITKATIHGLLYDEMNTLISASQTTALDLVPSEERFFQIAIPVSPEASEAELKEPKIFIQVER